MSQYAWLFLILAGLTEVIWAFFMKQSNGFSKLLPTILFTIFAIISMILLALAIKYIQLSIAYPIWVGIGVAGTVLLGILIFKEHISLMKCIFLSMIIIGTIGIKISN
jgi:quaternary ammonium compound-resistance protein SugE